MKWSVVVPGTVSDRLAEAAIRAEQAGLYRLWTTESTGRDAILRSLHLLQATKTLRSGTGIAFAFTRPPLAAAGSAADAYTLSGGRFSLGLGAGTRGQRRWYQADFEHPAARLADYVRAIKAVLRSDGTVRYAGRFYELSVPRVGLAMPPELLSQLKIYGGGLHEQMLQAIARSCDGVVLHPLAGGVRYLDEVVLPALGSVTPDDGVPPSLIVWCPLSIAEDEATARRRAAEQLAFYFTTPSYLDVATRSGFGAVAGELVERFNQGAARPAFADLAGLIPDEMLSFFVVYGTPGQVARQLAERAAGWQQRGVQEVALQISAQLVTSADLLTQLDHIASLLPAITGPPQLHV
jgi:alkanesulfonate monooxygenase SsuD/methylene tetrahydromethanopterin reductase-like flavin-dependent oxidoreductase (luciferase family)